MKQLILLLSIIISLYANSQYDKYYTEGNKIVEIVNANIISELQKNSSTLKLKLFHTKNDIYTQDTYTWPFIEVTGELESTSDDYKTFQYLLFIEQDSKNNQIAGTIKNIKIDDSLDNSLLYMNNKIFTDSKMNSNLLANKTILGYDLYNVLLTVYFIILIIGIIKGSGDNRSIIVFKNYDDLGLTFLVPASFILINLIFMYLGGDSKLGIIIAAIVSIGLFLKLITQAYQDNNNSILVTVLVVLIKLPISIIWILNFIQVLNPSGKGSERTKNRGQALVILALLTPIIGLLVADKTGSYFNPKSWIAGKRVGSSVRNNL